MEPLKADRWRYRREPDRDHYRMDGPDFIGGHAAERIDGGGHQLRGHGRESLQ